MPIAGGLVIRPANWLLPVHGPGLGLGLVAITILIHFQFLGVHVEAPGKGTNSRFKSSSCRGD